MTKHSDFINLYQILKFNKINKTSILRMIGTPSHDKKFLQISTKKTHFSTLFEKL